MNTRQEFVKKNTKDGTSSLIDIAIDTYKKELERTSIIERKKIFENFKNTFGEEYLSFLESTNDQTIYKIKDSRFYIKYKFEYNYSLYCRKNGLFFKPSSEALLVASNINCLKHLGQHIYEFYTKNDESIFSKIKNYLINIFTKK